MLIRPARFDVSCPTNPQDNHVGSEPFSHNADPTQQTHSHGIIPEWCVLSQASSELHILRNPKTESGYRCVYPHHRGKLWKAAIYDHKIRLGLHPTPRAAAIAVIEWWRSNFGEHWAEAYESHRVMPWVVTKAPGGFRLTVWEFGRKRTLPPDNPRWIVFPTANAAREHLQIWKIRRYGLWANHHWLFLRRSGGEEYESFFQPKFRPKAPGKKRLPSPTPPFPKLAPDLRN